MTNEEWNTMKLELRNHCSVEITRAERPRVEHPLRTDVFFRLAIDDGTHGIEVDLTVAQAIELCDWIERRLEVKT